MNTAAVEPCPRLVAFGEVLWDIFEDQAHIGGAPFNVAAHAVQCGLKADLVSRVGADVLGRRALDEIRRRGVGATLVQTDAAHPTGTVSVTLSGAGQPSYTIHPGRAWDFIEVVEDTVRRVSPSSVNLFYFGSLAQRSPVSRDGLRRLLKSLNGVTTFFDVNLRQHYYSRELIEEGCRHATIVKLNEGECVTLSELLWGRAREVRDFARQLQQDYGVHRVVVTQAERGCLVTEGDHLVHYPGVAAEVADAVGAGDAFTAAFVAGILRGLPVSEVAGVANRLGAFVVSQRGAIPDYTDEIRAAVRFPHAGRT